MGEELSDVHIYLAQRLLRAQFPELNGLLSTLLQGKRQWLLKKKEMLQIIHSTSHHHWIVATTILEAKEKAMFLCMIQSSKLFIGKPKKFFMAFSRVYQLLISRS